MSREDIKLALPVVRHPGMIVAYATAWNGPRDGLPNRVSGAALGKFSDDSGVATSSEGS